MKNKDNNNIIPTQALELLPWYALGLLEGQEKQFVEKALLEFPQLQEQLKLECEMAEHLREEEALFSLSSIEGGEERLEALLEREEFQSQNVELQKESPTNMGSKFSEFFQSLFSGHISKTQYMGFTAVTTFSIALLFAFAMPLLNNETTFYPASVKTEKENTDNSQDKNTLLVGLNVTPTDARLAKIFNEYKVKTHSVAGKDGMYRLSFDKTKPNATDLKKLLSVLSKQKDLVWFVGEAY